MSSDAERIQFNFEKTIFGFWLYVMTDCALFATLFVTYVIHRTSFFGGPTSFELFNPWDAMKETLVLLTSSLSSGVALYYSYKKKHYQVILCIIATLALGATFLALEIKEFMEFYLSGATWERSSFLSSFFTLVGTHGAHITIGLFWMLVLLPQLFYRGITSDTHRRVACFSIFWHFLDLIWVGIFTIVYLWGILE